MVSRTLFYQINLQLIEIFGVNKPFGGQSVIVCGHVYQLPPVNLPAIYSQLDLRKVTVKDINGLELWYLFKMAELTEVIRQRGDTRLIEMLNKIGVEDVDDVVESLLKSRLAVQKEVSYPTEALHLFAENTPADEQNKFMINELNSECVLIKAIDKFPMNLVFSETDYEFIKNAKLSVTGNLAYSLELKIGAKVILTCNTDIEDCLINGQIGTVYHFMSNHQQVLRIYVKTDDLRAGIKASSHDNLGRSNSWVPIEQSRATFTLKKKSKNSVAVTRTQFPLTLSYACTDHKVLGISLSKAVVSLNLYKQNAL